MPKSTKKTLEPGDAFKQVALLSWPDKLDGKVQPTFTPRVKPVTHSVPANQQITTITNDTVRDALKQDAERKRKINIALTGISDKCPKCQEPWGYTPKDDGMKVTVTQWCTVCNHSQDRVFVV